MSTSPSNVDQKTAGGTGYICPFMGGAACQPLTCALACKYTRTVADMERPGGEVVESHYFCGMAPSDNVDLIPSVYETRTRKVRSLDWSTINSGPTPTPRPESW